MDAPTDVFAALGLHPRDAHVIRNAGGRVTADVLRSVALSTRVLGVDTVVVMQHTKSGLVTLIAGFVYDVESGRIDDVVRWERPT